MRINVSAWSIRRPVPAIVLFAVLMLLGVLSFKRLPVTRFPNIDVPIVSVKVTQSGAAPAELETQVTKVVEDAVANITGVKHITSTLTDGTSTTVLEFRLETDTDRALNDVKDAIATKSRRTCRARSTSRSSSASTSKARRFCRIAATSPGMTLEAAVLARRRRHQAAAAGDKGRRPGRTLWRRRSRNPRQSRSRQTSGLRHHGRGSEPVRCARPTSISAPAAAKSAARSRRSACLPARGGVKTLADAKIILGGGREVRLKDLGRVVDDASEQRSFGRLNGQPVVSFSIFRIKGIERDFGCRCRRQDAQGTRDRNIPTSS